MTKITLRGYNREVENMIEGGILDESVAHCQHILRTFPMHVETYRLLGKCFLEARRYTDAADIFQRALMAVPDDFVAHVGMSIIRDDEGKLDDAIWHMERAFEDQPSNPAIQGELRRLYGRRDGVEPAKIRLSRDALANMYAQGELFNQAIAEIRAVLAEDSNRPDLQIMLARAYYNSGQMVEAAEMAANLLKKYTYCLEALRILVDVLPETASGENTQVYHQRLLMLDPYSAFVTGSAFGAGQVSDTAVNLERLEYKADAAPAFPQPNWASSLGIKLGEEKHIEPAPDWMRTAIWQHSSSKRQEGSGEPSPEQPTEPLPQAEIPDWLRSMAPKEVSVAEQADSKPAPANGSSSKEGDAPDRLPERETSASDVNSESSRPSTIAQDNGTFPDWLKGMDENASIGSAGAFVADAMEQPHAEEPPVLSHPTSPLPDPQIPINPVVSAARPDDETAFQSTGESNPHKNDDAMTWLENLSYKQGAEEELFNKAENHSDDIPDWLGPPDEHPSVSSAPEPTHPPRETLPLEPRVPLAGESAVNIPESSEIVPVPLRGEELPAPVSPAEGSDQPFNIQDDTMAWLESLSAKEGAKEGVFPTNPENHSEGIPDMVRTTDEQPSASAFPEPSPAATKTMHLEPLYPFAGEAAVNAPESIEEPPFITTPAEGATQPPKIEDETMTWLDGLATEEAAKTGDLLVNPDEVSETPPDRIQKTILVHDALDEALATEASQEDITITSWLRKQDVIDALGENNPTPEVPQPRTTPSNELPDWLKELKKPSASEEMLEPFEDLPDWLGQPVETAENAATSVPTAEQSPEQAESPAWIDETIPVSEPPAPTTPGEWVPVDEKPALIPDIKPIPEESSVAVDSPGQLRILGGTGMLSRIPAQDKDAELLAAAQASLDANQLNEAMQAYAKLIKKNHLLDEVVHDLREATYRFPVDIIVWQTLGDASMRANRLQDALDAYTKAEELLR